MSRGQAIELEIDRRAHLGKLFEEAVVVRDALAIGVDHNKRNPTRMSGLHKSMICGWMVGFAAGELHHLRVAFGADKIVEHRFDFFQGQAEAGCASAKHSGAIHIVGAVDFNNAEAGVLLMVWA